MDKGHKYADKILEKIEKQIGRDITSKYAEDRIRRYLEKHKAEIDEMLERLDDGEITQREFGNWVDRTLLRGREWRKVRDDIADDYVKQMEEAIAKTGVLITAAYLYNRNYTSELIEKALATKGKVISIKRIKNITKPIIPKSPDPTKNKMWHRQKLQMAIRNGMKKGESIPKIAKRVQKVTGMDRKAAVRTARTAVTAAESKARLDSMFDAEAEGIYMTKRWYATKDSRTRTSHRIIDGEEVPIDQEFSNGLMYPADPDGDPAEVYNCRCTLMGVPEGIDLLSLPQAPFGMGRLEWIGQKPRSKPL
jgi:SPP1 gp7 family putative phage head morphogenesis protein